MLVHFTAASHSEIWYRGVWILLAMMGRTRVQGSNGCHPWLSYGIVVKSIGYCLHYYMWLLRWGVVWVVKCIKYLGCGLVAIKEGVAEVGIK